MYNNYFTKWRCWGGHWGNQRFFYGVHAHHWPPPGSAPAYPWENILSFQQVLGLPRDLLSVWCTHKTFRRRLPWGILSNVWTSSADFFLRPKNSSFRLMRKTDGNVLAEWCYGFYPFVPVFLCVFISVLVHSLVQLATCQSFCVFPVSLPCPSPPLRQSQLHPIHSSTSAFLSPHSSVCHILLQLPTMSGSPPWFFALFWCILVHLCFV